MRKPMEDSLDMPLRDVLEHMQKHMMHHSSYFGIQAWKCPTDFWMYQEIIFETRPDVIIEIGCALDFPLGKHKRTKAKITHSKSHPSKI